MSFKNLNNSSCSQIFQEHSLQKEGSYSYHARNARLRPMSETAITTCHQPSPAKRLLKVEAKQSRNDGAYCEIPTTISSRALLRYRGLIYPSEPTCPDQLDVAWISWVRGLVSLEAVSRKGAASVPLFSFAVKLPRPNNRSYPITVQKPKTPCVEEQVLQGSTLRQYNGWKASCCMYEMTIHECSQGRMPLHGRILNRPTNNWLPKSIYPTSR